MQKSEFTHETESEKLPVLGAVSVFGMAVQFEALTVAGTVIVAACAAVPCRRGRAASATAHPSARNRTTSFMAVSFAKGGRPHAAPPIRQPRTVDARTHGLAAVDPRRPRRSAAYASGSLQPGDPVRAPLATRSPM